MSITEKIASLRSKSKKGRLNRKPILRQLTAYKHLLIVTDIDTSFSQSDLAPFSGANFSYLKPRSQKEDNSDNASYTYHKADLNLTGKVKNDKLNTMLQMPFDLVLDLSTDEPIGRFLLERLNQSFMIGKKDTEKSFLYDLMIENESNASESIKIMIEQLMLLSQNGNK